MEFRQLKYFVTVAEEMQFLGASKKLYISQPALSQQIKLLENELGVDLFVKSKRQIYRKVELTEEGKTFLKDAKKILSLCEKAKNDIAKSNHKKQGIKLGTYRMLIGKRIIETVELFANNFPDLDIILEELPTFLNVQEAVYEDEIDIGISVLPLQYKNLDYIILKKSELHVILPKQHRLAKNKSISLPQLKNEKWIEITSSFHPIINEVESLCLNSGFSRLKNIVQEVSSLEVMAQLVGLKKGIAFVPSFFDTKSIKNIVNRPLDAPITFEQCLIYKKDKMSYFIEALKK
jgi:DNA-binding transcriptional LysR family regulator